MSKQLLVDFIPFDITPQMLSEAKANTNGPLVLKGPLKKPVKRIITVVYIHAKY